MFEISVRDIDMPGVYSPMPMGAFRAVAKLLVDNAEKFCRWCLKDFSCKGETIMLAFAECFYSTQGIDINEVRMAYTINKKTSSEALQFHGRLLRLLRDT